MVETYDVGNVAVKPVDPISDLLTRLRKRSCKDLECKNVSCRLSRDAVGEIEYLRLQLERDAATYVTMQKGMESQAKLIDGLKQRVRELEAALKPFAKYAVLISRGPLLEDTPDGCPLRLKYGGSNGEPPTLGDCRRAREVLENDYNRLGSVPVAGWALGPLE